MRYEYDNGVGFHYADEVGFAFMPCVLKASGSKVASLSVEITSNKFGRTYSVDAIGGEAIMDYREFVQAAFDDSSSVSAGVDWTVEYDRSNLCRRFDFDAVAFDENGKNLGEVVFNTLYVWGACTPRETWNGFRHLTWFTNFPFSFGLYLGKENTNVLIGYNDAPNTLLKVPVAGIVDFMPSALPTGCKHATIYDYDGEIQQGTFDDTFDLTFRLTSGGKQSKLLRIDYDDTESGIYLRWIDRHGFVRYWLFTQGDETRAMGTDGEFIRNNLSAYSPIYGYVGVNGRRQGYTREDTIPICASNVDRETYDMLQDLTTSPVVDMFIGGDWRDESDMWQSVTIKAGSYTKTTACLQDFVCEIVLNDIKIQKL